MRFSCFCSFCFFFIGAHLILSWCVRFLRWGHFEGQFVHPGFLTGSFGTAGAVAGHACHQKTERVNIMFLGRFHWVMRPGRCQPKRNISALSSTSERSKRGEGGADVPTILCQLDGTHLLLLNLPHATAYWRMPTPHGDGTLVVERRREESRGEVGKRVLIDLFSGWQLFSSCSLCLCWLSGHP